MLLFRHVLFNVPVLRAENPNSGPGIGYLAKYSSVRCKWMDEVYLYFFHCLSFVAGAGAAGSSRLCLEAVMKMMAIIFPFPFLLSFCISHQRRLTLTR